MHNIRAPASANRAEIARRSGLARSTVGQQVDHLVGTGILEEVESRRSVRGRPPRVLEISSQAGTVAVVDVDTAESQVAIALHAVRQAATEIGEVVAMLVHMFNPRTLVLSGPLSELRDDLVSAVRAAVYQRALPLATRKLTITATQLKGASGLHGGIALATQDIFSPAGIAGLLADEPRLEGPAGR
ncbi:ROK family protein [Streptomyces sp. NPDC054770]